MSRETGLWRYLREGMRGRWHVQRHEDKLSTGIPDLSFALPARRVEPTGSVDGWIELKRCEWPAREETEVDIGLRADQATWLEDRGRAGSGACYVLAQVGREYMLFHWKRCRLVVGKVPRHVLRDRAQARWEGRINWDELEEELRR